MKQQKLYFLLNKEKDFRRGDCRNIAVDSSGLALSAGAACGTYYSRIFDSTQRGTVWHRMKISGLFINPSFTVTIYAGENDDSSPSKDGAAQDNDTPLFVKITTQKEYVNLTDILLDGIVGQYMWFKICIRQNNNNTVKISRIKITFPKRDWLMLLPEIYQEDTKSSAFLSRYLSIFQSMYDDMTDAIDSIPQRLAAQNSSVQDNSVQDSAAQNSSVQDSAAQDNSVQDNSVQNNSALYELAKWFSIEHMEIWNTDQLRYLVRNAVRLSGFYGTAACLKELIFLGTKETCYIVEYCQLEPFFDGGIVEARLKQLYAMHPYAFTILIDRKNQSKPEDFYLVSEIVDMVKPAYMESHIVALTPYIFLDQHSYLGINSVLGHYRPLCLDGTCAMPFSVIVEEGEV